MADTGAASPGMRRKPLQARSQERVRRILQVAEALFVAEGYAATTTSAIAARAQVPIGSLYQFFPDKAAILKALAQHYNELLYQQFVALGQTAGDLPLPTYLEQLIDTTDRFFSEQPGYYAVFIQALGSVPEIADIEAAADAQLIQDLAWALAQREPRLAPADCDAIAFVLVKAIGTLLWLSLSQAPPFRQRLVAETKRFAVSYLQSYLT